MTPNQKINLIRQSLDLKASSFAKLVGISPATMSRLSDPDNPHEVSDKILDRVAKAVDGVTLEWLKNEADEQLPAIVKAGPPVRSTDEGEGTRLKRFIARYEIKQRQLAEVMEKDRVSITYYMQSRQFSPEVRDSILAGLSQLLDRPVLAREVFGDARSTPVAAHQTTWPIPRITVRQRDSLTSDELERISFVSTTKPTTTYFVDHSQIQAGRETDYFALEIGPYDRMEPKLQAGYWVLAELMEPGEYNRVADGMVAVMTRNGDFYVRRVQQNALNSRDELTLIPFAENSGATIMLHSKDIALLFRLPRILDGRL